MPGTLVPLDGAVPAAFANRRPSGMLDAARAGVQASFAVIGYRGKNWRLKHRGTEVLLRDGQGRPMTGLEVVVVGVAPSISKIYYGKAYVEGDDSAPDCFSIDGLTPDPTAPKIQNPECGTCKHNQWGSRVTDAGKRAKSCQDSRRIAVVPLQDITNEALGGPMLLRIPPTSLPNLAGYADMLVRKGADMPWVGTVLSFDTDVAYPKITFEALGFLSDEQSVQVVEAMESPLVERMLHDASPVETGQAPAAGGQPADPDISGKPPAAMTGAAVVPLRRAAAPPQPQPQPQTQPEPEPEPEPQPEPQPEPEAAQGAEAETTVVNPFAAATRAQGAQAAQGAAPVKAATNGAAPAVTRTRRVASATQTPAAAPADLESAIDDLLQDNA